MRQGVQSKRAALPLDKHQRGPRRSARLCASPGLPALLPQQAKCAPDLACEKRAPHQPLPLLACHAGIGLRLCHQAEQQVCGHRVQHRRDNLGQSVCADKQRCVIDAVAQLWAQGYTDPLLQRVRDILHTPNDEEVSGQLLRLQCVSANAQRELQCTLNASQVARASSIRTQRRQPHMPCKTTQDGNAREGALAA